MFRACNSGRHADGAAPMSFDAAASAEKYRFAKTTSSVVMNAASLNLALRTAVPTLTVTRRYRRLNHFTPSLSGNLSSIAVMIAMASSMECAGVLCRI